MSTPPQNPKAYHITHIDNLAGISSTGYLVSDATRITNNIASTNIGLTDIKQRRLSIEVPCNPRTYVGEYVPFNFCYRSVMLFMIYKANYGQLAYRGGQEPVVHLQFDVNALVDWTSRQRILWAFSNVNAATSYADFYRTYTDLNKINWTSVDARDFKNPLVKDQKQAEFLVYEYVPWSFVERIGVISNRWVSQVETILSGVTYVPQITAQPHWYY